MIDVRFRLYAALLITFFPILPLVLRLAHLQVMRHEDLNSRAAGEFERSSQEIIPRGNIVDRNGHILARSIPSWSCFIEKPLLKSPEAEAAALGRLLGMPSDEILRKIKKGGRFVPIKSGIPFETFTKISQALGAKRNPKKPSPLEGVGLTAGQERVYPNEDLARNILGSVRGDGSAVAGVEMAFEDKLLGTARKFKIIRDGSGHAIYESEEGERFLPPDLALTIDRSMQYYSEEALKEAAAKFSIKSGVVAVQDPNNGEILAMATYPSNPLKNIAIQDSFEPGSTFKVIAAVAALAESVVSESETIFCENGKYELAPGVVIHDHEKEGALTLSGIIERSSNIGMAKIVERLGATRFTRYSRAFGFANKTGVNLPGETAGVMRPVSEATKVVLAASSYGYGVGVSALQLLSAYSAIANGGTLWEPTIIKTGESPSRIRRVAPEKAIAALSKMLEAVVDRGTGVQAQIPGYRVAGKTGTSRRLDPVTKEYSMSLYTASFVGYIPAGKPQLTILIRIDEPRGAYYGAQVAAPVFAKLGRQLLALKGIPPDHSVQLAGTAP